MKTGMQRPFAWALLGCLMIAVTGCSSFNSQWKAAGTQPSSASGLEGRWEGYWVSANNGHTGKLRAIVKPLGGDTYETQYHATFWKLFSYAYAVKMQAKKDKNDYLLRGEENLGWLAGGIYTYEGKVTPTNFFSTYRNKYDFGTFQMTRVPPAPAPAAPRRSGGL